MLTRLSERLSRQAAGVSGAALRGATVFAVAGAFTVVAGLLFHVMMSRALGPAEYGALAAVLNLLLVATVPLAAVELAVAAAVGSSSVDGGRPNLGSLTFRTVLAGGLVSLVGILVAAPVARFLHMTSPDPVVMAALYLGLATMAAPLRGVLLGGLHYVRVAGALVLMGCVKLGLGLWLLLVGGNLIWAMAVLMAAELAQVAAVAFGNRRLGPGSSTGSEPKIRVNSAMRSTAAMAGLCLLASGDLIVARKLFQADAGGIYAAAGTAAHALLFIPQIVLQAAFPLLVRSKGPERRRRFWSAVAVSLTLSGLVGSVMVAAPGVVIRLLFGVEFLPAVPLLRSLVPATLAVGIVYAVVHLHIAARNGSALIAWVGVAGLAAVTAVEPRTPGQFSWWVLGISVGSALWALAGARRAWQSADDAGSTLSSPPTREVTVVVPFLNPGPGVRETINGIVRIFESRRVDVEVVAVSDGSTDGSTELMREMATTDSRIRLVTFPQNRGKGAALKAGMAHARGEWIGMLDADGDIPAEVLGSFFDLARVYHPDGVVGSKRHPLSRVQVSWRHRLLSVGFELVTRVLFRLGVGDTQTGAKLFHRQALAAALPATMETGYAFDLELLVAARAAGYRKLATAPVTVKRSFASTVSLSSAVGVAWATGTIVARMATGRYHQPPSALAGKSSLAGFTVPVVG